MRLQIHTNYKPQLLTADYRNIKLIRSHIAHTQFLLYTLYKNVKGGEIIVQNLAD